MLSQLIGLKQKKIFFAKKFFSTMLSTRLKATFQTFSEEKKNFKQSHCQWTISVGYPAHENERLESTGELINKSFGRCTLMLDDSLQWRTLALKYPNKSEQELIAMSIENGNDWLRRNYYVYSQLAIPCEIVRWKDLVQLPQFLPALHEMREKVLIDPSIQNAIDITIDNFLARSDTNNILLSNKLSYEKVRLLCKDYLVEEGAVMWRIWPTFIKADYEVYPSKRSPFMETIYTSYIRPEYGDILKSVCLRYARRNIEAVTGQGEKYGNRQGPQP